MTCGRHEDQPAQPVGKPYRVRYIHKIRPDERDTGPEINLPDSAFKDSGSLGMALRRQGALGKGGYIREFRIETRWTICFPVMPGMTTYWHAIVLVPAELPRQDGPVPGAS